MPTSYYILLLLYPLFVHISITFGYIILSVYFLAVLLFLPGLTTLFRWKKNQLDESISLKQILFDTGFAIIAITILLIPENYAIKLLQLQPIVIFSMQLILFSSSLRANSVPIITRFFALMVNHTPEPVRQYGRNATIVWSVFFFIMLSVAIYLVLFASLQSWSLFTNFLSYILITILFIADFLLARYLLRGTIDYGFLQFFRKISQYKYKNIINGEQI